MARFPSSVTRISSPSCTPSATRISLGITNCPFLLSLTDLVNVIRPLLEYDYSIRVKNPASKLTPSGKYQADSVRDYPSPMRLSQAFKRGVGRKGSQYG